MTLIKVASMTFESGFKWFVQLSKVQVSCAVSCELVGNSVFQYFREKRQTGYAFAVVRDVRVKARLFADECDRDDYRAVGVAVLGTRLM